MTTGFTVKQSRVRGFVNIGTRECVTCGVRFAGRSFETLCPKCETRRKLSTYVAETTPANGWLNLPCGGHMRNTIHRD